MTNTTRAIRPDWLVGFIDGEGTFFIDVLRNSSMALGFQVQLAFIVSQHDRDIDLLYSFVTFFGGGQVVPNGLNKSIYRLRRPDLMEANLFPLLDKYPLLTQKHLDAEAFRKVHGMMKDKKHLTAEGLADIRAIQSTMNRGRMTNSPQKIDTVPLREVYRVR